MEYNCTWNYNNNHNQNTIRCRPLRRIPQSDGLVVVLQDVVSRTIFPEPEKEIVLITFV